MRVEISLAFKKDQKDNGGNAKKIADKAALELGLPQVWTVTENNGNNTFDLIRGGVRRRAIYAMDPLAYQFIFPGMSVLCVYEYMRKDRMKIVGVYGFGQTEGPLLFIPGFWNEAFQSPAKVGIGNNLEVENRTLLSNESQVVFQTNTNDTDRERFTPWGLHYVKHENESAKLVTDGVFSNVSELILCNPVRRESDLVCFVNVSGFEFSSLSRNWNVRFDDEIVWQPGDNGSRSCKSFYNQVGRWVHVIPFANTDDPYIYSVKRNGAKSRTLLNKKAFGASFVDFAESESVAGITALLILPLINTSNTSIDIWRFKDRGASSLGSLLKRITIGEMTSLEPIDSGSNEIAGPPWLLEYCNLFQSSKNSADSIASRSSYCYRYPSGMAYNRVETIEATESPTVISDASFISEGLAYEVLTSVPIYFEGGSGSEDQWDLPGVDEGSSSNSAYKTFSDTGFFQFPAISQNQNRYTDCNSANNIAYPTANAGGGEHIDSSGFLWRIITRPVQQLMGGEYEIVFRSGDTETFSRSKQYQEDRVYSTGLELYVEPSETDYLLAYAAADREFINSGSRYDEDREETYTFDAYYDYTEATSIGMKSSNKARYNQVLFNLQKTVCIAVNMLTGEEFETDISQYINLPHTVAEIIPNPSSVDVSIPVTDNCFQALSFPEISKLFILRDLRTDGPGFLPSLAFEVWDYSGGREAMALLSSTSLASSELIASDFASFVAGDRLFDSSALKNPSMKADPSCIVVGVFEQSRTLAPEDADNRSVFFFVDITDPLSPVFTREESGLSGHDPDPPAPTWEDWESVIIANGDMIWTNDSLIRVKDN